jgi:hypothetical protein
LEVTGPTLFLRRADGQAVDVDLSKLDAARRPQLRLGTLVEVVAVRVGNKFEATGFIETETRGGSTSAAPARPAAVDQSPAVYHRPALREVVYPHGKYVLYGDGVTQPYQWVWIPAASRASSPIRPQ